MHLEYIKTESPAADIFTKALAPQKSGIGTRTDLSEVLVDVGSKSK